MDFEEYLKHKKIDGKAFYLAEPEIFHEWKRLFEVIHPESFINQKKFKINEVRRRFRLEEK